MSLANKIIQKRLDEYRAAPLLPLELPAILQTLDSEESTLESFKPFYAQDPVFCWQLVETAWISTRNRVSHPFAADHALSTIGIGGVSQLCEPLARYAQENISDEVNFCLSSSLLAAELARQLGELNLGKPQTYWSALFYQLPGTLLWHMQPQAMWRIYYRRLTLPKKMTLFEESKLGFNLYEWRMAVAETFHMDEQLRNIYELKLPNIPKELYEYSQNGFINQPASFKDWHKQEALLVVLANRLAKAIIVPWHGRSYQHICSLLQHLLYCDQKQIIQKIRSSILEVSQNLKGSSLFNPAVSWLMQTSKPDFPDWLVKPLQTTHNKWRKILSQQTKTSSTQATAKPIRTNQTTENRVTQTDTDQPVSALIKKLSLQPSKYPSSSALLLDAMNAFISLLGFSRASLLLVDHKIKSAKTKVALSKEGVEKIYPDFDFKLPTPLINFTDKQTLMLISREKHQNIWHKLPQAIQQKQVEKFIFCSLQARSRVNAIIYLQADGEECYQPETMDKTKRLLQAINKALKIRSQAKARTKQ